MDLKLKQKEANGLGGLYLSILLVSIGMSLLIRVILGVVLQGMISVPVWMSVFMAQVFLVIPAFIYLPAKEGTFRGQLGFRKIRPATILLSLLMTLAVWPIFTFVNVLSQFVVPNTVVTVMEEVSGSTSSTVFTLLASTVLAPICEEIVFRGVFAKRYDAITSSLRAGLISGLFFGIVHMNLNQMGYAFVLGVFFALANKAAGSIFPSIIMHVVINLVNMVALLTSQTMMANNGTSMMEAMENINMKSVLLIALVIYFVMAVAGLAASIPCLEFMAKTEGRLEEYKRDLLKKQDGEEQFEHPRLLLNIPTIAGLAVGIIIIILSVVNSIA